MHNTVPEATSFQNIAAELTARLTTQYGAMLGSSALIKELSYPSAASFQRALARGVVPVPVFKIEHRRGSFALATDVAEWLSRQRANVPLTK